MKAKQIQIGVVLKTRGARELARVAGQIQKPLLQRLIKEVREGRAEAFTLTTLAVKVKGKLTIKERLTFSCPPTVAGSFVIEC